MTFDRSVVTNALGATKAGASRVGNAVGCQTLPDPMLQVTRLREMVDPYNPDPGRRELDEYQRRIGELLTEEFLDDTGDAERTRAALRHINEGDLRPRVGDT